MMHRSLLLPLLLLGAACGGREGEHEDETEVPSVARLEDVAGEAGLVLDSATIARIGLQTAPLAAVTRRPEVELAGVVVSDPGATVTIRAGVSGRLAAVEGGRWPRVGDRLGEGTAVAQVSDARPVIVPHGGSVTAIHAFPGEIVQAGQPLLELVDYGAPVIRVAWDGAEPPPAVQVMAVNGGPRRPATLVGPAPTADPLTAAPAWLYRVTGIAFRPGTAVAAFAPTGGRALTGVLIPNRAVVQWDALPWAYVEREPGRFVRVRVPATAPEPDGWLAESGFRPGDRVVVTGAGLLLSEEFRARIVVGEEVGE